jgi:hypothetical protein
VTIADSSYRTRYGSTTAFAPPAAWNDVRRTRLAELVGEQEFIARAPLFLVWLADLARARHITTEIGSATARPRTSYELEPQEAHVHAYEQALNTFYANAGLPTSWIARVAARFGTVAGLKGREHLREALQLRGFQLR